MPAPSEPLNVLTRNTGNGSLEAAWTAPVSGAVHHYDVYISSSSTGVFVKANRFPIVHRIARIYNLKFGLTIYTKVKAVAADGLESGFSALAVDAIAGRAIMDLRFHGNSGDAIPAGAMFSALVKDELIGVKTLVGGTIP